MWQSSSPEGAIRGWSGAIADRRQGLNQSPVFTSISVAGNQVMMSGGEAVQYQVSPGGVSTLANGARAFRHPSAFAGISEILGTPRTGPFGSALSTVSGRAISSASQLSAAVGAVDHDIDDLFDLGSTNSSLAGAAEQLAMVARLIAAGRTQLGMQRQAFFVSIGGFDTHENMIDRHDLLHETLNSVLPSFHRATRELGVGAGVTTFTASDFGRGLVSNGSGADHGWGGHHMVIGDDVAGRRVVGNVPVVAIDGPDDVGHGRLIPTIGVEQYAATFARWMGVADADLSYVAPDLDNFAIRDLGLFKTAQPDPTPTTPPPGASTPATPPSATPTTTVPSTEADPPPRPVTKVPPATPDAKKGSGVAPVAELSSATRVGSG
jgi:hypothetical protein